MYFIISLEQHSSINSSKKKTIVCFSEFFLNSVNHVRFSSEPLIFNRWHIHLLMHHIFFNMEQISIRLCHLRGEKETRWNPLAIVSHALFAFSLSFILRVFCPSRLAAHILELLDSTKIFTVALAFHSHLFALPRSISLLFWGGMYFYWCATICCCHSILNVFLWKWWRRWNKFFVWVY